MAGQLWAVVGGEGRGGLLVRVGRELSSPEAGTRLSSGSLVRELQLEGERLKYELVSGTGPAFGWVTTRSGGRPLLEPAPAAGGGAGPAAAPAKAAEELLPWEVPLARSREEKPEVAAVRQEPDLWEPLEELLPWEVPQARAREEKPAPAAARQEALEATKAAAPGRGGWSCRVCRACADLLPGREADDHTEQDCGLLNGSAFPAHGDDWEHLALYSFAPPPDGTPPLRLLSLADDDGGGGTGFGAGALPLERLGFRIWPAARLLLEALAGLAGLGRVLELGAGTGVVGLSLAWRGAAESALLTDRDETCVRLLRANAVVSGMEARVAAAPLALGEEPAGAFDTVVASDVIWDPDHPCRTDQLLHTASAALGDRGGFLLLGYQHRQPALSSALLEAAARCGAAVQEVRSGRVPGEMPLCLGDTWSKLSVYRFQFAAAGGG